MVRMLDGTSTVNIHIDHLLEHAFDITFVLAQELLTQETVCNGAWAAIGPTSAGAACGRPELCGNCSSPDMALLTLTHANLLLSVVARVRGIDPVTEARLQMSV